MSKTATKKIQYAQALTAELIEGFAHVHFREVAAQTKEDDDG